MRNLLLNRTSFFTILIWVWGISLVSAAASFSKATPYKEYLNTTTQIIDLSIMGEPIATKEQCVSYLFRHNPFPLINTTPQELVDLYYAEGAAEGIRSDVAFAQALHETGNFHYGGDVVNLQNNYCGLGTTGKGVKGAWFPSPRSGVRAQIQHLLAYTTTRPPHTPIIDPRYELVKNSDKFAQSHTWTQLNGKWAVPGRTYGQMILKIHENIIRGR